MPDNKKPIPGIIVTVAQAISEDTSEKKIQEIYERNFKSDVITEGSRHGNNFFPMDYSDFFLS